MLIELQARAGHFDPKRLLEGRQLRFNLFVHDANPMLTKELTDLFREGTQKIAVDGLMEFEITLAMTKHWD